MLDNKIKIKLLLNISLFFIIYLALFFITKHKAVLFIISIFSLFRLILDYFLILYGLLNDEKMKLFVEKISKHKISSSVSWEKRKHGVNKWIIINYIVLIIFLIIF